MLKLKLYRDKKPKMHFNVSLDNPNPQKSGNMLSNTYINIPESFWSRKMHFRHLTVTLAVFDIAGTHFDSVIGNMETERPGVAHWLISNDTFDESRIAGTHFDSVIGNMETERPGVAHWLIFKKNFRL